MQLSPSQARVSSDDLPLKHFRLRKQDAPSVPWHPEKLLGRKCPMKRIRHHRADAQRKYFGLPRPTPPRFRARAPSRHARRQTIAVPKPEQNNALRVPSGLRLPSFLCC
jgi:hypothetical protein